MKKIVILISGRGSNMQAIVQASQAQQWPAQIAAVISNKPDAAGLAYAASQGIPTKVVDSKSFASREDFDTALMHAIDNYQADLVVLAGFMRILTPDFVQHYENRIMNIHPSLLPSFVGLHTHQQALDAGVKFHGATVHFVTAELDHGPIIDQACVRIEHGDDENSLASKLLVKEHVLYPRAVRLFVEGKLVVQGNRVIVNGSEADHCAI
ncbi:phosphoribosylglycinamide formyltransferase [Undibacterium fentianense]|uniref:Phosphoribosylglycinamide formyltransferase n=1 Tax=Undibacterium fentianense TaxID=2828728 RepID=A0A941E787_9BURK|nr:phosphoribosylglycinamide formyltransferase [Undibacterium fentianense]MBR7799988.1 phosphoribosylglycinamide formyltransferase [Undibacterium fentianense]